MGSGQPRVWMTRSNGVFVSQSSFTPSAKIGGLSDGHVLPLQPGLGQGPARAFREHRDLRDHVGGRSEGAAGLCRRA